jgi:hypothetical protein
MFSLVDTLILNYPQHQIRMTSSILIPTFMWTFRLPVERVVLTMQLDESLTFFEAQCKIAEQTSYWTDAKDLLLLFPLHYFESTLYSKVYHYLETILPTKGKQYTMQFLRMMLDYSLTTVITYPLV